MTIIVIGLKYNIIFLNNLLIEYYSYYLDKPVSIIRLTYEKHLSCNSIHEYKCTQVQVNAHVHYVFLCVYWNFITEHSTY